MVAQLEYFFNYYLFINNCVWHSGVGGRGGGGDMRHLPSIDFRAHRHFVFGPAAHVGEWGRGAPPPPPMRQPTYDMPLWPRCIKFAFERK